MPTTSDSQATIGTERRPEAVSPIDETNAANLDKVRELLFGSHMRDYDQRFARLEERLIRETSELRTEVRERLSVLEDFVKREMESLFERITGEHDARVRADETTSRELRETSGAFDKRATALDEQLARAQRDLRQQVFAQDQRLSEEIRRRIDDVLARVQDESSTLRNDKADRATISSLLTEMALRLNNQLSIPGLGEGRKG